MTKSVFLCGFMGCGKSTVGKVAAGMLGMQFIDLDEYIEEKGYKARSHYLSMRRWVFDAVRKIQKGGDRYGWLDDALH